MTIALGALLLFIGLAFGFIAGCIYESEHDNEPRVCLDCLDGNHAACSGCACFSPRHDMKRL